MKSKMILRKGQTLIRIDPFATPDGAGPLHPRITVHKATSVEDGTSWGPAVVNWNAIGSVSPTEAEQFARGLMAASLLAEMLDAHEIVELLTGNDCYVTIPEEAIADWPLYQSMIEAALDWRQAREKYLGLGDSPSARSVPLLRALNETKAAFWAAMGNLVGQVESRAGE